uniref:Uncharacterized protein n=1 Tax=Leersia perrieri TaxID=77586 RepID=A0A0D9WLS6_9ORYZ
MTGLTCWRIAIPDRITACSAIWSKKGVLPGQQSAPRRQRPAWWPGRLGTRLHIRPTRQTASSCKEPNEAKRRGGSTLAAEIIQSLEKSIPRPSSGQLSYTTSIFRPRLVYEFFLQKYHIKYLTGCRKGFLDINEKTNFMASLETAR